MNSVSEVAIIGFSTFQQSNNKSIAESGAPNHTVSNTVSDILLFIPGVTASLVVFLVFGTTKSWRQYRDLVFGGCSVRRKMYERRIQRNEEGNSGGLEFERLPSLSNRESEDNATKAERRVRMFVTSVSQEPEGHNSVDGNAPTEPPAHTGALSRSTNLNFSQPRFVPIADPSPHPDANPYNIPREFTRPYSEDPVIQYGHVEEETRQETNLSRAPDSRRFVSERLPRKDPTDVLSGSSG